MTAEIHQNSAQWIISNLYYFEADFMCDKNL